MSADIRTHRFVSHFPAAQGAKLTAHVRPVRYPHKAVIFEAFRSITRDDLGREALAEGLKKIVIRNSNGNYSMDSGATFAGGVLTFDHDSVSNVDYWEERRDFLIRMLEKAL